MQNSVSEDGSGWEKAEDIYKAGRDDILKRYPVQNPQRHADLALYLETQSARRGFAAANAKQSQMGTFYRAREEKEIAGAVARLEVNPSQDTLDAARGPLNEMVQDGKGLYNSNAQIEARQRQIESALLLGQLKGLMAPGPNGDPEAANELMRRIRSGKYDIDQPRSDLRRCSGGE